MPRTGEEVVRDFVCLGKFSTFNFLTIEQLFENIKMLQLKYLNNLILNPYAKR